MLYLDLVLASVLSVQPADVAPAPAPAPAPTSDEAASPPAEAAPVDAAPVDAAPADAAPADATPAAASAEPAPATTQTVQVMPLPPDEPTPAAEPYQPPPRKPRLPSSYGIGFVAAGPTLILLGIPASLLGNMLWRDGCGPNTSNGACARGTVGSMGMHAVAGIGYSLGITFTGIGAGRRAEYAVSTRSGGDPGGALAGGGVLLPLGLIGMIVSRSLFWLPTPKCLEYSCVQRYQTYSTLTVAGSAMVAAAGAGLLMYGGELKKGKRNRNVSLAPTLGRHSAGLSLTGAF